MKKLLFALITILILTSCSSVSKKEYLENELMAAVAVDNVFVLNRDIKNGFDIDQVLQNGETLLSLALKENSVETIAYLLSEGADTSRLLPARKIPGTDITICARQPMFYISSLEALNFFIKDKVNLNQIDACGELLLNYYIKTKPEEVAIDLIRNNASLKIVDSSKWYPIFWAVNVENENIIKEMLKKDKNQYLLKDEKKNYPIYYANSKEVMLTLLEGSYNAGETNIYGENILGEVYLKAKDLGCDEVKKILLKKGVDRNYKSYE